MRVCVCTLLMLQFCCILRAESRVCGEITLSGRAAAKTLPASVYDLRGMSPRVNPSKVNESDRFKRVAVWLEGGPASLNPSAATMRQIDLQFDPELLIVAPGSRVRFPNFDPLFHNIFSLSPLQPFDLGYYAAGKSREVTF